jgi:hypothetical protein
MILYSLGITVQTTVTSPTISSAVRIITTPAVNSTSQAAVNSNSQITVNSTSQSTANSTSPTTTTTAVPSSVISTGLLILSIIDTNIFFSYSRSNKSKFLCKR